MTKEKFKSEVKILEIFFTKYCEDKHEQQYAHTYLFEENHFESTICLCDKCHDLLSYSLKRLKECPHHVKPRCRKCHNSCYDKKQWKQVAQVMRFSGTCFKVKKIKNTLLDILK